MRRWLQTVLGILAGAALAAGIRASFTSERVLVAADWDGDTSVIPLAAGFVNPSRNLQSQNVLYARLWTEVGGVWRARDASRRITDLTFTMAQPAQP